MLYRGTEFVEAVSEQEGKGAYIVSRDGDSVVEERVETRLLGRGASKVWARCQVSDLAALKGAEVKVSTQYQPVRP